MDRTQIIKGPAVVIRGGFTYFFREGLSLKTSLEAYDITASHVGVAGRHSKSKRVTISGVPSGMLDTAASYFPYNIGDVGSQIFGAADVPLVIHTLAGQKITFTASANLGVKTLHLGTDATALGEISFVCIGELDSVDTDSGSRYAVEATAYASTGYDFSKVRTPGYLGTYTTGISETTPVVSEIEGQDGFDVTIEPTFEDDVVNRVGLIGMTLTGIRASVTFKPANYSEAQILALLRMQGTGACMPGDDIALADSSLVIAPSAAGAKGVTLTLYNPGFSEAEMAFGFNAKRAGTVRADASLAWTAGVLGNLFSVAFPSWS